MRARAHMKKTLSEILGTPSARGLAEPECGRERFVAAIARVMAAVPDSQWTVLDTVAEDDRVAVRITWSGTYNASHFRAERRSRNRRPSTRQ